MVEAVAVTVGLVGAGMLAELVRRTVVGGRFERSLATVERGVAIEQHRPGPGV